MASHESQLWRWIKINTDHVETLDIRRIENMVENGTPDVEGCWDGFAFQIELKVIPKRPKTDRGGLRIKFQEDQPAWLEKRWHCGGACYVLIQVGKGTKAKRYLIPGNKLRKITKIIISESLLEELSICNPRDPALTVIRKARRL